MHAELSSRPTAPTESTTRGPVGFIVVCGMPFDESPPFGDTHLGRALAADAPTLVVDRPRAVNRLVSTSGGRRHFTGPWPVLSPIPGRPGSWVLRPVALPGSERPHLARLTDPLFAAQVEWAARRTLPEERVLVTFAPSRGLLPGVTRSLLVYWRRDLAASPHYTRAVGHIRSRHQRLLRSADLVTAVSPILVADAERVNPVAALIPNGADVAHFASGFERRRVRRAEHPLGRSGEGAVIGYAGAVSWRLDLELIDEVCRARPQWKIVLVGSCDVAVPQRANLVTTGPLPYAALPGQLAQFDVGVVPYLEDEFNRSSFPLKVFDYLATGIPVVSTRLPSLQDMEPFVTVAEPAAFVAAIEKILRTPPASEDCLEFAESHSWERRATQLLTLVEERRRSVPPAGRASA